MAFFKKDFRRTIIPITDVNPAEVLDLLVLSLENVYGAERLDDGTLKPSIRFAASVNLSTEEFSEKEGRLEWHIRNKGTYTDWGYNFSELQIYHIKCVKNPPIELEEYMSEIINNSYTVLEVIKDKKSDSRLEVLQAKLLKPAKLKIDSDTFTLNRQLSWFEGSTLWCGVLCTVYLETDSDSSDTAISASTHLQTLLSDDKGWDARFRTFAAAELIDTANDWAEDETIAEEDFAAMLHLSELTVSPDGNLILYYIDENDIFAGHAIEITATMENGPESADLVG